MHRELSHVARVLAVTVGALIWIVGIAVDLALEFRHTADTVEQRAGAAEMMFRITFTQARSATEAVATAASGRWHGWSSQFVYDVLHAAAQEPIRHVLMFDANGDQRAVSFSETAPALNVADRPYFKAAASGTQTAWFGPYLGRNTGRNSFAYVARIEDADGNFDGIVVTAMDVATLELLCAAALSPGVGLSIAHSSGEQVVSCSPDGVGSLATDTLVRMVGHQFVVRGRVDAAAVVRAWTARHLFQDVLILLGLILILVPSIYDRRR
jgi:hypothetical protein